MRKFQLTFEIHTDQFGLQRLNEAMREEMDAILLALEMNAGVSLDDSEREYAKGSCRVSEVVHW
tara:strand:- start:1276 stop:1467 length:192 start_codon:yes stop_codon:yes gene_type:complete